MSQLEINMRAYFQLPPGGTGGQPFGAALLLDSLDLPVPTVLCPAPTTAGANATWATIRCVVYGAVVVGVHDVFLRVDIPPGGAFNVLWWQASGGAGKASGGAPPVVQVQCAAIATKDGRLLGAPAGGGGLVTVGVETSPNPNTLMRLVDNEDGSYAVMVEGLAAPISSSSSSSYFWCAGTDAEASISASATSPTEDCARFRLIGTTDGSYAISAGGSGLFVSVVQQQQGGGTPFLGAVVGDPRNATGDAARFWLNECGDPLRGV